MAKPFKPSPGIGERLLELRGEMTREEFAVHVGMHSSSIGNYERGDRKLDADTLQLIAERTSADLNWLITGNGYVATENLPAIREGHIALPRYDIEASAGDGSSELTQAVADYMIVSEGWLSRLVPVGSRVGLLEARGDSMLPTIEDRDQMIILFDISNRDVADGGIFIVSYGGNLFVKRLEILLDGSIKIISDNTAYEPQVVEREVADELMHVHAKVVWVGGKPRG